MAKKHRRKSALMPWLIGIPAAAAILVGVLLWIGSVSAPADSVRTTAALPSLAATVPATPIPMATTAPLHTLEPTPVPTPTPIPVYDDLPYLIEVNYAAQIITVYTLDENGLYNTVVKRILTSSGKRVVCPTGKYSLHDKRRWHPFLDGSYGQYVTRITGHFLFHSLPYSKNERNDTLITKDYYELGENTSGGCMRMMVKDAKWIYENCPEGTPIVVWKGVEPDPSVYDSIVQPPLVNDNWDPTDPDEGNPAYFDESDATPPPTCCPNVTAAPWDMQPLAGVY